MDVVIGAAVIPPGEQNSTRPVTQTTASISPTSDMAAPMLAGSVTSIMTSAFLRPPLINLVLLRQSSLATARPSVPEAPTRKMRREFVGEDMGEVQTSIGCIARARNRLPGTVGAKISRRAALRRKCANVAVRSCHSTTCPDYPETRQHGEEITSPRAHSIQARPTGIPTAPSRLRLRLFENARPLVRRHQPALMQEPGWTLPRLRILLTVPPRWFQTKEEVCNPDGPIIAQVHGRSAKQPFNPASAAARSAKRAKDPDAQRLQSDRVDGLAGTPQIRSPAAVHRFPIPAIPAQAASPGLSPSRSNG